jgi:hypothetical protein
MVNIEEIINQITNDALISNYLARKLKDKPKILEQVIEPLRQAGFKGFNFIAKGDDSLLVSPVDNEKVVFRISIENYERHNSSPFFLATPYTHKVPMDGQEVKLELLPMAKATVTPDQKQFLLDQMDIAGWKTDRIEHLESKISGVEGQFWKDVVVLSVRKNGRIMNVPIISDPSASRNHLDNAIPFTQHPNICGSDYITMQDQSALYNQLINDDLRLKKLVPEVVVFPETEIIPQQIKKTFP